MALKFAPAVNDEDLPDIQEFDEKRARFFDIPKRRDVMHLKAEAKRLYSQWKGAPSLLTGEFRDANNPTFRWVPVDRDFTIVLEIDGKDMVILNIYHQSSEHPASR
jgi:hypothetical protein